jgi:hypothetical protein
MEPTAIVEPASAPPRGRRRLAFVSLMVLAAGSGVRLATLPESADNLAGELVLAVATALVCAVWCSFDARVLGKPAPSILLALVFLALPIGLPIHFLWSRGLRGILFGVGFAAAFMGVVIAAGYLAQFVVENR